MGVVPVDTSSQVPCEPKLLVTPLDPQQLAKFRLTSLERDPKRDLVLEPDLGIPLSVFDIGRYDDTVWA